MTVSIGRKCCVLVLALVGIAWFARDGGAQDASPPQAAIAEVIAAGTRVELIKGGFQGLEGPVATADGGLYFTEIPASRIHLLDRNGTLSVWRENTQGTNGLFLAPDGRLLAAEGGGKRLVAIMPDGRVTPLATQFQGKPLHAPNDLILDRKGGIYFTDPAPRDQQAAGTSRSNVHYLTPGGEVLLLDDRIVFPNGLSLSLDEKTLFVTDSDGHHLTAFDVQPDGRVQNKRQFVQLRDPVDSDRGVRSRSDGMAIDSIGRLYVTSGSGIQIISPRGEYLGTIRVPELIRNVAFSGPRRQTLYLTGATSLFRVQLLSQGPAGRAK